MEKRKKIIWGILLAVIPLIYTTLLHFSGSLDLFENRLVDFRHKNFNPNHKISDKVVIVDIDETALQVYANEPLFGRWPWKRNVYPPILEYIATGQPKLILFDILFTEYSPEDEALVYANKNLLNSEGTRGIISHAMSFRYEKDEKNLPQESSIRRYAFKVENNDPDLKTYNIVATPAGKLTRTAPYLHSVTFQPDSDGVARHVRLLFKYFDRLYPSLSLQAYRSISQLQSLSLFPNALLMKDKEIGEIHVPLIDGKYRVHFYPKSEIDNNLLRYSISGVIDSIRAIEAGEIEDFSDLKISPEAFTDKIVIIGTSAAATHDTKVTPYGAAPGVFMHAIAISNLINQDFLNILPSWVTILIVLLVTMISYYFLFLQSSIILRIIMPLSFIVAFLIIGFTLFKYDISLNLSIFLISFPVTFAGSISYLTFAEGAEKKKYSKVLSNMVDPTIVKEALTDLETLKKGGEKEITAFFSDVASFSTISEQLSSTDLASLLNEYLSAMTVILKHNKGTLDKYIGDAVVGIFGAPIEREKHYLEAARASLEMLERLEDLKAFWTKNNMYIKDAQEMNIRIGLNTGLAKVGFMGTDSLASYTMMGDTVNLAARLEAAGKDYGVSILISQITKSKIDKEMFTRELDAVVVKGKTEPVHIYELIGIHGQVNQKLVEATGLYEEGFRLHLNREWDKAIQKFRQSTKAKGKKDKAVDMLIERCEFYKSNPPPENWNGAFVRTHK